MSKTEKMAIGFAVWMGILLAFPFPLNLVIAMAPATIAYYMEHRDKEEE